MSQRTELEYKLAQMFIVGFQGIELSPSTQKFLEEYQPGGVIYFACNYDSPVQVYELSESVQNTRSKQNSLPLIVAVDHEGGRVQRFRKQFTHFQSPQYLVILILQN